MGPTGMRMESEEGSTMRNIIVRTVHLIIRMIKSRRLRWAGYVARMEYGRDAFKILTGTLTGKRLLGRSRCRLETIIQWTLNK